MEKKLIDGEWYVLYSDIVPNIKKHTLKEHDAFVVLDQNAEISCQGESEQGYYFRDTRFLSGLEFSFADKKLIYLSSDIGNLGAEVRSIFTNPDMEVSGIFLPRSSLYVKKSFALMDDDLWGNFHIENFSDKKIETFITICIKADFKDIFEVRGERRKKRGKNSMPSIHDKTIIFSYLGLDKITRKTFFTVSNEFQLLNVTVEDSVATARIKIPVVLSPAGDRRNSVDITFRTSMEDKEITESYSEVIAKRREKLLEYLKKITLIRSDNEKVNEVLSRAAKDLNLMITLVGDSPVVYAGIPWFSTIFGRDSIITAYQLLPWYPELTRGTLKVLSKYQGEKFDDFTEEEPGKILHELRRGEMANMREIPFIPYYGSVDSTPLFIILAWNYLFNSGDSEFIKDIWEHIIEAYRWITDKSHNPLLSDEGFLYYVKRSPKGLSNQGWKDSWDSVFYKNGKLARPPLAPVEAQGYRHRAMLDYADLGRFLKKITDEEYSDIKKKASKFRQRIKEYFYDKKRKIFALAIDGKKKKCSIKTSNMGYLLFAEAVSRSDAELIHHSLSESDIYNGFAIRTLSEKEARYNPISYHNGSVWPHDNSIICDGFSKYSFREKIGEIFMGITEAASYYPNYRIPELIGGFPLSEFHGPVPYPTACFPQAWASGSVFLMLKAMLGIKLDALNKIISFNKPHLPAGINSILIEDLPAGGGKFSISVTRNEGGIAVQIRKKPSGWKIEIR